MRMFVHIAKMKRIYIYFKIFFLMEQKLSCLKDFQVISKLGEGAFGQVFKVKRKLDGKQYAMKKIRIASMKPKQKQNALNEVRILASYDHQFIIGFKDAFYDELTETLCVVMEYAAGGDILKINQTHLKRHTRYKEEQIWTALVHMTSGLKSLHEQKILHRDLKCANVFVTDDQKYKLGDLNVSKVLKKDFACTQTGTPYYASPQVWKDQPYGIKSDMWSLGCVLYEMAALKPPFTANDLSGLYKKVCAGVFQRIPFQYSNDLQSVIASLLKLDPKKRPDTQQLLNNPMVQKYYKGQIESEGKDDSSTDCLLQTIKYNPKDLKGLKNILPKANYIGNQSEVPGSCKSIKKQPDFKKETQVKREDSKKEIDVKKSIQPKKDIVMQENQRKLKEFLQKRRQLEDRQRENHLKILKEQSHEQEKKKERILSACGIRNNKNILDSPRIAVHKKDEQPSMIAPINSCKPTRKDDISLPNAKLPPKPQGLGIIYKLPPKPSYHIPIPSAINKSSQISQRQQSKQNLRNLGARIVGDFKPVIPPPSRQNMVRCNSAQKIIYPNWWG